MIKNNDVNDPLPAFLIGVSSKREMGIHQTWLITPFQLHWVKAGTR
tara:strand:- start:288 stop:425 length:138 start_codon:yes stop_codon:yes gene_type:complete